METIKRAAAAAFVLVALTGPVMAADRAAIHLIAAEAPAPAAPDAPAAPTDWLTSLWQPFQNAASWIAGWMVAEEKAITDEVASFTKGLEDDLSALEQLVEDCGFSLDEIHIGVGPLPEVSLSLGYARHLEDAEREALLARVRAEDGAYGVIERALVDVMLAAGDSNYAAGKVDGYRLESLEVDVDLIPKVALVIVPASETESASAAKP